MAKNTRKKPIVKKQLKSNASISTQKPVPPTMPDPIQMVKNMCGVKD